MNEMIAAAHHRRGKWDGYGQMKRDWTLRIFADARNAKLRKVKSPVVVTFDWYEKDRRRDVDNVAAGAKFILDALVKAGVIAGDGQKDVIRVEHWFGISKDRPGVMVRVEPTPI